MEKYRVELNRKVSDDGDRVSVNLCFIGMADKKHEIQDAFESLFHSLTQDIAYHSTAVKCHIHRDNVMVRFTVIDLDLLAGDGITAESFDADGITILLNEVLIWETESGDLIQGKYNFNVFER